MRLGFYYHIPAIRKDGAIYLPGYLGCFLDSLASYLASVTLFLHSPEPGENIEFDYAIRSPNVKLIQLPCRGSVPFRMLHSGKFVGIFKENLSEMDAILLRGPSPLLPPIAQAMTGIHKIFMIVGDQLAGIESLHQPGWRKELIRLWSWYNAKRQIQVSKKCLVFVNSRVLYRQFERKVKHLVETRTTTLTIDDFFKREDTCLSLPVKLLFTGRIDQAKGVLDLVEVVSLLVRQGDNVVLDLVGWPDKKSDILERINQKARELNISERVNYLGYKAVGPELFACYRQADIYVLASQSSFEGFPRTIWEAMAHCLPVVATRVGSIPDFITGAAELVEPKNPQNLSAGISKVIHNTSLRQEYISKGFVLASQNTLKTQVGEMARVMKDWVKTNAQN